MNAPKATKSRIPNGQTVVYEFYLKKLFKKYQAGAGDAAWWQGPCAARPRHAEHHARRQTESPNHAHLPEVCLRLPPKLKTAAHAFSRACLTWSPRGPHSHNPLSGSTAPRLFPKRPSTGLSLGSTPAPPSRECGLPPSPLVPFAQVHVRWPRGASCPPSPPPPLPALPSSPTYTNTAYSCPLGSDGTGSTTPKI